MVIVPHCLFYQADPFIILWFKTATCVENFILCWATAYAVALSRIPLLAGCDNFSLNLSSFTSRQHRLRFGLLTWTTKVIQHLAKILPLNPKEGYHTESMTSGCWATSHSQTSFLPPNPRASESVLGTHQVRVIPILSIVPSLLTWSDGLLV